MSGGHYPKGDSKKTRVGQVYERTAVEVVKTPSSWGALLLDGTPPSP